MLYLGNSSASRRTVSMPSRARAEAQYDPAGPPPMMRTVVFCGIDMMTWWMGS